MGRHISKSAITHKGPILRPTHCWLYWPPTLQAPVQPHCLHCLYLRPWWQLCKLDRRQQYSNCNVSVKVPKCWLVCRGSASNFNGNRGLKEEKFLRHDDNPLLDSHSLSQNNIELRPLLRLVCRLERVVRCGWRSHYGFSDTLIYLWNTDRLYPKI